eukprot:CAMPEP_0116135504 /NCGR_PEP_ID=MMETSP0329-20121206/11223_1 /TAXON_ID=697910 /ORGANISM="Pseudo-nitzschia arenysensis, Strain B593" /LENGTH=407 /DNA_ID=CAMNT_0003630303 /DNA_START=1 /DNA_END=1224 /DNA_ORIENTATION=-
MKLSSSFLFFATLLSVGNRSVLADETQSFANCYVCLDGGCDQTSCGDGAICAGGGCNQNGLKGPICPAGRCTQVDATNPICNGGSCDQTGSTRAQCFGGICCREGAEAGGVCFNCKQSGCEASDANYDWKEELKNNPYVPDNAKDAALNGGDWQNNPYVVEHCGADCGTNWQNNPYVQEYYVNNDYVTQWTKANNAEFNYTDYVYDSACSDCQESDGCDQTSCAPFPSCDNGKCDQQGTSAPICNGGLCNQQGASTPICPGGWCCQDAPTILSCPGGGCEDACEVLANLTAIVSEAVTDVVEHCTCYDGGCDQTGCSGYPNCYGGDCIQTGQEAPSCFGGNCEQSGANNPGCLGGYCVQTGATGIFQSCIGGGCETDAAEAAESSGSKIGTAFAAVVLVAGIASAMI